MKLILSVLALTALSPLAALAKSAPAPKAEVLIDDDFNDNDLKVNTAGKGTWFTRGEKTALATEDKGMATVSLSSEESNRALYSNDKFNFWNDTGVTVTWKVGPSNIQAPSPWKGHYNTIVWDLAVISAKADKKVSPYLPMQNFGGFYVRLGQQKNVPDAQLSVNITNKNLGFHNNDILPGQPGYAKPTEIVLNVKYPLTITAKLDKKGWSVFVKQDVEDIRLSGNWTTDIASAPITDEFSDGAFLLMHCRNNGFDGKHYEAPYAVNTFAIDRVTLATNGRAAH